MTTDKQNCNVRRLLAWLQSLFVKQDCCAGHENQPISDHDIRRKIGGTSATSAHEKPGTHGSNE